MLQTGRKMAMAYSERERESKRRSENTSDKKSIVHTLSLKEGFLWGIYNRVINLGINCQITLC